MKILTYLQMLILTVFPLFNFACSHRSGDSEMREKQHASTADGKRRTSSSTKVSNGVLDELSSRAVNAYRGGDVDELRRSTFVLTNGVGVTCRWELDPFSGSFEQAVNENFLRKKNHELFLSEEQLRNYLSLNIEAAVLLGMGEIYSRRADELAVAIEYLVYGRLKSFADEYRRVKNDVLLKVSLAFLDQWVAYIESEYGFSRVVARRQYEFELSRIISPTRKNRIQAVRVARSYAQGLIKCGYQPIWLDRDFPLTLLQVEDSQ